MVNLSGKCVKRHERRYDDDYENDQSKKDIVQEV
jgi:hypothetical protein